MSIIDKLIRELEKKGYTKSKIRKIIKHDLKKYYYK